MGVRIARDLAKVYLKYIYKEPGRQVYMLGVEQWREHSRHGNSIAKEQSYNTACHLQSIDTAGNEIRPTQVIRHLSALGSQLGSTSVIENRRGLLCDSG